MELHAVAVQGSDLLRGLAANQVKLDIRQLFSDQGPDPADEPDCSIDIRGVLVTANEKNVFSISPRSTAANDFMDIADDVYPGFWCIPFQHGFFNRADDQGRISILDYRQFGTASLGRHSLQWKTVFEFRQPLFPEVMKIHCVKNEFCIRTISFQQGNIVRRHVVPADHYEREFGPSLREKIMQGIQPGTVNDFNAGLLQIDGVSAVMPPIVCKKSHAVAKLANAIQKITQPQAAGILVWFRGVGVNDQNSTFQSVIPGLSDRGSIVRMRYRIRIAGQFILPAFKKFLAVDGLITFCAATDVRAGSDAFVVNDRGPGLYPNLQASCAQLKSKVCVFIVGRRVPGVEAPQVPEQLRFQHDACTGAVVHFPHKLVLRFICLIVPAIIPAGAVIEYNSAVFLQAAIGVDQAGPGHAGIGEAVKCLQQGIQPAFQNLGIIVE